MKTKLPVPLIPTDEYTIAEMAGLSLTSLSFTTSKYIVQQKFLKKFPSITAEKWQDVSEHKTRAKAEAAIKKLKAHAI